MTNILNFNFRKSHRGSILKPEDMYEQEINTNHFKVMHGHGGTACSQLLTVLVSLVKK